MRKFFGFEEIFVIVLLLMLGCSIFAVTVHKPRVVAAIERLRAAQQSPPAASGPSMGDALDVVQRVYGAPERTALETALAQSRMELWLDTNGNTTTTLSGVKDVVGATDRYSGDKRLTFIHIGKEYVLECWLSDGQIAEILMLYPLIDTSTPQ